MGEVFAIGFSDRGSTPLISILRFFNLIARKAQRNKGNVKKYFAVGGEQECQIFAQTVKKYLSCLVVLIKELYNFLPFKEAISGNLLR